MVMDKSNIYLFFRSSTMVSRNELLDNYPLPNEDQLIPKTKSIDLDFTKKEKTEEECNVESGQIVSFEIDKVSVKEELCEHDEIDNHSSSNVRNNLLFLF